MKAICKSLLIASLAALVILVSASAADVGYGEDEQNYAQYANGTQGTSVVVNPDLGYEVCLPPPPKDIPEFSTIAIPVASILGLLFFFNYRKRRREQ